MCGIAGKFHFNNHFVAQNEIVGMTTQMTRRGPDDSGYYISKDRKCALGNRRLAIVDLSKKGHQPMFSKDGRYVIVSNGEMYNFRAERELLKKEGYVFESDCDTEVILALFDKYKEKCLSHLRGMFAFAIYDSLKKEVFLARDRIGKKPLHYYLSKDVFIFASEIKSILTQKEVSAKPNLTSIAKYLSYGYIPSPFTGFSNIKKLPPGHYMKVDIKTGKILVSRYWEPKFATKLDLSESAWCKYILETLSESTKIRMESEVPVGAFLSGGVDSSAVVASMALLSKNRVNTFTISFKDGEWDESKYADKIAKMYKTNHHKIDVGPQDISILPEICKNFEEPFADAGVILSYIVNKYAKKYATVILNGDGGDELFAGYPNRHFRLKRDVDYFDYINMVRPAAVFGLRAINKSFPGVTSRKLEQFFNKSKLPLYERFASYNQVFSMDDILSLVKGNLKNEILNTNIHEEIENCFKLFKGKDLKDAGLKFDLLYWLPDDLLAKADKSAMYSSVEGRSPILDQEMIELSGKIPFDLKVKRGEGKYIFKKALEKIVPKENLYRKKMGFGLPLHKFFTGKVREYAKSVLLSKSVRIKEFVNKDELSNLFTEYKKGVDNGPKIWSLMTLELFLKNYF